MLIRSLLGQPPDDQDRASQLRQLVQPLCVDTDAQEEFLKTAQWSVSFSTDIYYLPTQLALDVMAYVVSICGRYNNGVTWLEQANVFLGEDPRFHQLRAHAWAVQGHFDKATQEALRGAALGEPQAVALAAHLEAQRARSMTADGYQNGMFDKALAITDTEPTARWSAVAAAAVLATRARLLLERAFWLSSDREFSDRQEATGILRRIVSGPFPTAVRLRAADLLCLETQLLSNNRIGCQAAARFGHLGALENEDSRQLSAQHPLYAIRQQWRSLNEHDWVIVVFRGPTSELMEWAGATEQLLSRLAQLGVRLVVINHSSDVWSTSLITRLLTRAHALRPLILDRHQQQHRRGVSFVGCVAALMARHKRPQDCPLSSSEAETLRQAPFPAFVLAVGRNLDADLSDLLLYKHRVVLASIRRSEMVEKGLFAWLKSVSDVLVLVP